MTALEDLQSGLRTLLDRPAAIAPYYLLTIGATVIARTPLTLGGGVAVAELRVRGRIEPVVRLLDDIDPAADPAGEGALTAAQQEALAGLVTPTVVLVIVLAALASAALYVICRGAVSAGVIHALFAPLNGREPCAAGASGIERDWLPLVAIGIVRSAIYLGSAAGIALALGLSATGIGLLLGLPLLLVSMVVLLVGHLVLAFAGQAVVVDSRRTIGAIAHSVRFPLRAPTAFVLYVSLGLVLVIVFVIAVPIMELAGISRVSGVLLALVLAPVMDAAKTGLYAGRAGAIVDRSEQPAASAGQTEPDRELRRGVARLLAGQRRGLGELVTFLRTHPLANFSGLVLFALGTGLGWLLTGPYGVRLDAPEDVAGVFGEVAVGPFINIAANNWQVAIGQAFGGIGFGLPTIANVLYNGVLIGAVAGIFDRTAFLALVVPHGLVEVPGLVISGGVGIHLGVVGYRWARGRADAETVGTHIQQATWVLVGLLPVFVIAAFVEAFLTPWIAAAVLG